MKLHSSSKSALPETPFLSRVKSRGSEAAYTLFEIMLVLGIISVLVGSAIYLLAGNIDVAKEQRVSSDFQTIGTQLRTYEILNYTLPTTEQGLEALVTMPGSEPVPARWHRLLDKIPLDPWGTPYLYRYPPKVSNTKGYDLISLGPDKKESDDDIKQP